MGQRSDERVVGARIGGNRGDVNQFRRWEEYLVNDVNDTVAGGNISGCDVSVIDHDGSVGHGEGGVVAVDHRGHQPVGDIGCVHGAREDVVE